MVDLWALEIDVVDAVGDHIHVEWVRDLVAVAVMRELELHLAGGELEVLRPSQERVRVWMMPHGDVVERREP